jgi:hypothetical protein
MTRFLEIFLAVALTLLVGCIPPTPPPDPPVPPETAFCVAVVVTSPSEGIGLPGASVSVSGLSGETDEFAYLYLKPVPAGPQTLTVTKNGYEDWSQVVEVNSWNCDHAVEMAKIPSPVIVLPRLVPAGQFLQLSTGQRFTAIEASDFNLYSRFLDGEDINPIFKQRAEAGYNMLRVWTLYNLEAANIGKLLLSDHPDLYDKLPLFTAAAAQFGLYVEFTAYTSTWDAQHWGRLTQALLPITNSLAEMVNEEDQPANTLPDIADTFTCPAGLLCSHGSNGSQAWPVEPPWGYETFHTNGASEWWRKTGHNAAEISWAPGHGRPVIANENTRFCDNDSSINRAYDAAAGAALLAAGSAYHSVSGKSSVLWQGCELDAAHAWAAGAASVPLEFQAGRYIHRDDLEGPNDLRVYERRLSDGRGYIVRIRK